MHFFSGLVGFLIVMALVLAIIVTVADAKETIASMLRRLSFGPWRKLKSIAEPYYADCRGTLLLFNERPERVLPAVLRLVESDTARTANSLPYPLGRYWWRIDDSSSTENSAQLVLDYVEDITRFDNHMFDGAPNFQKFQLILNLAWSQPYEGEHFFGVDWKFVVHNDFKMKSNAAKFVVDYTLDALKNSVNPSPKSLIKPAIQGQDLADLILRGRRSESKFTRPRRYEGGENLFHTVPKHIVQTSSWPSPQDFNEAVQTPRSVFTATQLKSAQPELSDMGLPRPITGAFASVYKMQSEQGVWAVKCFLRGVEDQQERYRMISDGLSRCKLDSAVGFEFINDGILVHGRYYPVLKMDWQEGEDLIEFVDACRNDAQALDTLCIRFVELVQSLQNAGIAHGDLQHGNILITESGLRLVDYDGMFVPGMLGLKSNELGHRNYQHPQRTEMHFGPYIDNFSAWLIYLSVRCIALDPSLWERSESGDEALLFHQLDFADPLHSSLFQELTVHDNSDVRDFATFLRALCLGGIERIPPVVLTVPSLDSLVDHSRVIIGDDKK